eukprot:TRINITY_DN10045_c0_g2_i1.p2 TRINITY_DN10045_c0_g2~~TRINITY_DN10045_c0_g2_i1.p2  ORF type:complete len:358 (+),score=133.18 TRINITY_DN10045_c0_g2_i1:2-1075(+)
MAAQPKLDGVGIVALPYPDAVNDAAYMVMWAEPTADGQRGLSMGFPHLREVAYNATLGRYVMDTPTWKLHSANGTVDRARVDWHYSWDSGEYLDWLGAYDPAKDAGLDGFGFAPAASRLHRVIGQRHRPPDVWISPDGISFVYSVWDRVYAPPPAPHPWSRMRGVLVWGMYDYAQWALVLEALAEMNPDTTVVAYADDARKHVHALSTGQPFLRAGCHGTTGLMQATCLLTLGDLPEAVLGVHTAFKEWERETGALPGAARSHFMKADAGGEAFFARQQHLFHDNYVLWMRPASAVQDKVDAALYLLVLFSALVFAFDFLLAVLEYIFVARPMIDLSEAITALGSMDTKQADRHLAV